MVMETNRDAAPQEWAERTPAHRRQTRTPPRGVEAPPAHQIRPQPPVRQAVSAVPRMDIAIEDLHPGSFRRKHKRRSLKRRVARAIRQFVFMTIFLPLWLVLRPIVRHLPRAIFAVYGTERDQRAYWPGWFDGVLRRLFPVFPIGILKTPVGWGLIVASAFREDELDRDHQLAADYVQQVKRLFTRARGIALAGRLPTWYYRSGNQPSDNVVDGAFGTRFAMLACIAHATKQAGINSTRSTLCLLGGGGRIGEQIAVDLAREWRGVVALDTRFHSEEQSGNIFKTGRPQRVGLADLTLVLTSRGRDVEPYAGFFRQGTWVVDDTHPTMPPELVKRVIGRGVTLRKAVTADSSRQLQMIPRLPNFRPGDAPGCLIEALVVAEHGPGALESFEGFVTLATDMFEPVLHEHLRVQ